MKNKILLSLIISAIYCSSNAVDMKKSINSIKSPAPIGTYSQAIQFGNMIYMSGQIAIDPKTGELIHGGFKDQARQVFMNISEVAKAAGGNMNAIIKLTVYVTDLKNFKDVNDVMKEYFKQPYPVRSVVEVKALAKNAEIEIEATMGVY